MSGQDTLVSKKKRGPKPTGQGKQIQVRMHAALLNAVDNWIAEQPDPKPGRPEAVRELLKLQLGLE